MLIRRECKQEASSLRSVNSRGRVWSLSTVHSLVRNRGERLTGFLDTKSVIAVDAVVLQLRLDAVNCLGYVWERTDLTVPVCCLVIVAGDFDVVATSIHWFCEECAYDRVSEPFESRRDKTHDSAMKASRPCRSSKRRAD